MNPPLKSAFVIFILCREINRMRRQKETQCVPRLLFARYFCW